MIEIDPIRREYPFPSIDFKFINRGNATALMWEFSMRVARVEIDWSPVLRWKYQSGPSAGGLHVSVENVGWGPAFNLRGTVSNRVLDRLYPEHARSFQLQQPVSHDARGGIVVSPRSVDPILFARIREEEYARARQDMEKSLPEYLKWNRVSENDRSYLKYVSESRQRFEESWNDAIILGDTTVSCEYELADSRTNARSFGLGRGEHAGALYVTPHGVFAKDNFRAACVAFSDTTYCTLIEPDRGPHTRSYRIARKIAAGDVERFHIMVGATKSCSMTIVFGFSVDESNHIESSPFDLSLRVEPRELYGFEDGDVLYKRDAVNGPFLKLDESSRRFR